MSSELIGVILVVFLVFLLYKLMTNNFDYWKNKGVPYVKPTILFGNFFDILTFRTTIGEYFEKYYNKMRNEPFFGMFVFTRPILIVNSPELIKTIMVKDFHKFPDRAVKSSEYDSLTQHMLFLGKSPDWKIMRTKISHSFSTGKQKNTIPIMNEIGENMKNYIKKNIINNGGSIEAKELCGKFATDAIARIAFSVNAHSFEDENADFRRLSRLLFDYRLKTSISQTAYFFLPKLVDLFHLKFIDSKVTDYLRKTFWDVIDQRKANNFKGNDIIHVIMDLLENKSFVEKMNFYGDKALAPAVQFFVAGSDTVASTSSFTLYEFSLNPEIQEKARTEVIECLKKYGGICYESIKAMNYLNMCVYETLRKYPVLPFLDRVAKEDYQFPNTNITIDKGTFVYVSMFGIHMDPEYWPNPQKYNPERFSEENLSNIIPYTFFPFGIGPRVCVGERLGLMMTKIILINFLSEFKVKKGEKRPYPILFEPKSLFITAKGGLPIKIEKLYE